jgi:hypothetical protein
VAGVWAQVPQKSVISLDFRLSCRYYLFGLDEPFEKASSSLGNARVRFTSEQWLMFPAKFQVPTSIQNDLTFEVF